MVSLENSIKLRKNKYTHTHTFTSEAKGRGAVIHWFTPQRANPGYRQQLGTSSRFATQVAGSESTVIAVASRGMH